MGEAKQRKERGEYPTRSERFTPGPVKVGRAWVWLESDGSVRRMTVSGRIHHPQIVRLAWDAARKRESRIIRPAGPELVLPG